MRTERPSLAVTAVRLSFSFMPDQTPFALNVNL
jgi:hypothetical protein